MTALAMSLEMLGKTAGDYAGDAERINLVAQTFHDDLIADKRGAVHVTGPAHVTPTIATMRLPDFLELAAVAEEMTANTPEAAKAAQAVAKSQIDEKLSGQARAPLRDGLHSNHDSLGLGGTGRQEDQLIARW